MESNISSLCDVHCFCQMAESDDGRETPLVKCHRCGFTKPLYAPASFTIKADGDCDTMIERTTSEWVSVDRVEYVTTSEFRERYPNDQGSNS